MTKKCPKCGKRLPMPKGAVIYLIDELGEGDDMFEAGVVVIAERELDDLEKEDLFNRLYGCNEESDEYDTAGWYEKVIAEFSKESGVAMYLDQDPELVHLWEEVDDDDSSLMEAIEQESGKRLTDEDMDEIKKCIRKDRIMNSSSGKKKRKR